jgi:alkanesulfonate monooxygenase SsuD/methylene tetrahydromethanopterin reductase-like flavin-dependent oxidoreductase (luciferase family)/putative sterol carrier protein
VRFSLFYELQLPRPWDEDSEQRLFDEALEQIRLADKLGFHCVWAVEHHFLEEYAHSSASAVWLAAAAAQTERIRIGLGIMPLPPGYQHPARVAEAAATLDLVSHGRVELGTGETSSETELAGFGVDRATKRAQWQESIDVVTRMLTETPFSGHDGPYLQIPQRNVVPKPRQKPHPPLWLACSQRETIRHAAANGLGALGFSFTTPAEAGAWTKEYYDLIASDRCVPAGLAANPNFALALPMHVHADEETAKQRGAEGARFFGYALAHYYAFGDHRPGFSDVYAEFKERGDRVDLTGSAEQSASSAIGTPEQVVELARGYEDAGVDELILAVQIGATKHEHILESLELFAKEVMPEFEQRRPELEAEKASRLEGHLKAARDRRSPAKPPDPRYIVAPASRETSARVPERELTATIPNVGSLKARFAARTEGAIKGFVARSSDARLEKLAGSSIGLKTIFKAMESRYVPEKATGFDGEIQYDLKYEDGRTTTWSIALDSQRAEAKNAPSADPALKISSTIADFVRIAGGDLAPAKALLTGRIDINGDLVVAARLGEMFGQASPF